MNEIKCPHCGKAFTIDEAGYADILRQVRDEAFEAAVHERLALAEQTSRAEHERDKAEIARRLAEETSRKDSEIERLKEELKSSAELAAAKAVNSLKDESARKDTEIAALKAQLEKTDVAQRLALREALSTVEKERDALQHSLQAKDAEQQLQAQHLKERYEVQLRDRDEAIERLRDMKARLSTKMVGETLEQHCEIEFNKIRSTAFPTAYFEKDTDVRDGSKGDYIFRDSDEDGTEFISIMFEMKNESDETATKKKNEDFLAELDKDRNQKSCEYAVLVSLLEADSELYNQGIVDVSHRFPKMYVIRPQMFIPMITVLRNAAIKSLDQRRELARIREQNIDITNFEAELDGFKAAFGRNYDLASRQFESAIEEIDKSIDRLEKVKEYLTKSGRNLRLANDKADELTIKKLTRNNPTMASKFKELRSPVADPPSEDLHD